MEEFWRDERYSFLEKIKSNFIITCHHLDDCVETWLMSSIRGQSKLIPYKRGQKIFRPFLMTARSTIDKYAEQNDLQWVEDPSNDTVVHTRNYTRKILMPHIMKINPGIRTTIRKKLIEKYDQV
jgi:tRNA(Ile)-lysidine synthase